MIYTPKEIENFLLVPTAIDWAAVNKIAEQAKRTGLEISYASDSANPNHAPRGAFLYVC
jgi:hypothetical protein